jgi:hypothetical protein
MTMATQTQISLQQLKATENQANKANPSRTTKARTQRIEVWREEVARNSMLCDCPSPRASLSSRSSISDTHTQSISPNDPVPRCALCSRLGAPPVLGDNESVPRRRDMWSGIKHLAHRYSRYSIRDNTTPDWQKGSGAIAVAKSIDNRTSSQTNMYKPPAPASRDNSGSSGRRARDRPGSWNVEDEDSTGSSNGVRAIIAAKQERLRRAQKMLGKLHQTSLQKQEVAVNG